MRVLHAIGRTTIKQRMDFLGFLYYWSGLASMATATGLAIAYKTGPAPDSQDWGMFWSFLWPGLALFMAGGCLRFGMPWDLFRKIPPAQHPKNKQP